MTQDKSSLKGLALQIAAQLPDDRQTALTVLDYAREVVEWRAADMKPVLRATAELFALPRGPGDPPPAA